MDPVTLLQNGSALLQSLLVPLGGILLFAGLCAWGASKPLDSPRMSSIGSKSMLGGVILGAAPTVVGLLRAIGNRIGFTFAG